MFNFIHNLIYQNFIQNTSFSFTTFLYQKHRNKTHNNKSEINNTFLFSYEMSIASRPLNFCLLMQHTRPCYIVGHALRIQDLQTCS